MARYLYKRKKHKYARHIAIAIVTAIIMVLIH